MKRTQPEQTEQRKRVRRTIIEPWPHQAQALDVIEKHLDVATFDGESEDDSRHIRIQMACGTGKSAVAAWAIQRYAEKYKGKFAVLVPTIHLQSQIAETIRELAPELTVGLVGDNHAQLDAQVTVCIYNSVAKLRRGFSFIIVDESHHIEGVFGPDSAEGVWREAVRDLDAPTVLLTATPLADTDPDFSYTLKQAIEDKNLVDFALNIPIYRGYDPKKDQMGSSLRSQLVELIKLHPEWTRILAYTNTCYAAIQFRDELKRQGIAAHYFDSSTPLDMREKFISDLEAKRVRALCTVQVLGEGVDIPSSDTCMFVDPRNSAINVTQCVGRVLRLHAGKQLAHVVCPSLDQEDELKRIVNLLNDSCELVGQRIINRDTNFIRFFGDASFDMATLGDMHAFERVSGMLQPRTSWEMKFQQLKDFLDAHDGQYPKQRDATGLGRWVKYNKELFARRKRNRTVDEWTDHEKQLAALPGWKWVVRPRSTLTWEEKYQQLKDFLDVHDGQYPLRRDPTGLGLWLYTNRQQFKRNGRDRPANEWTEQEKQLAQLPGWRWKITQWDELFEKLQEKVSFNGPAYFKFIGDQEQSLKRWIYKQAARMETSDLEDHQAAQLRSLPGYDAWYESRVNTKTDEENLAEARAYFATHARTSRPSPFKMFGRWIALQRKQFKQRGIDRTQDEWTELEKQLGEILDWI